MEHEAHICFNEACYKSHGREQWTMPGKYTVTFEYKTAKLVFTVYSDSKEAAIVEATKDFVIMVGAEALKSWHFRSCFRG